jgi:hypothetical protein
MGGMCILTFLYSTIFMKIYILPPLKFDWITYTMLSPLAVGPTIIAYGWEMCREQIKHSKNWS